MKEKFHELCFKLDILTVRERVIILGLAVIGLGMGWLVWIWEPMGIEIVNLDKSVTTLENQVVSLGNDKLLAKAKHEADPDAKNRKSKESLIAEVARLDTQIANRTDSLIPPAKMVSVLEEWLGGRSDLELTNMEILPATPLSKGASASGGQQIFKHGIVMNLRGTYLSTLRHLKSLEGLKWHFVWDSLSYKVVGWPEANIRLQVHTISTEDKVLEF